MLRERKDGLTLREAILDDLDAIVKIHIDGNEEAPYIKYCCPLRHQYPEDYRKWTRKEYENYLKDPEKWLVHVVDASIPVDDEGGNVTRPIGVAVWDVAVLSKATHTDVGLPQRRDMNKMHTISFSIAEGKRFKTFFSQFMEQQVHLFVLVVHPDFRRRGAGTIMVNWGIKHAENRGWPVTLCASPMGRFLYKYLGFKQTGIEAVQVAREEESLESFAMVKGNTMRK